MVASYNSHNTKGDVRYIQLKSGEGFQKTSQMRHENKPQKALSPPALKQFALAKSLLLKRQLSKIYLLPSLSYNKSPTYGCNISNSLSLLFRLFEVTYLSV